ncbi:transposase family protein, partial [Pseudomonadota bacterium]
EFLEILFNLHNSNVSRTIRHISPLLARIFHIPERKVKLTDNEIETMKYLFIDGTEQPIQRPKNRKKQKEYYSGKKKRHTVKVQVATRDGKMIDAVSRSHNGRKHDKKMYDETRLIKPPGIKGVGDTGYEGTTLIRPVKRKKGKKLTKAQKKYNHKISSIRIKAEHAIAKMKKYRITKDIFRNPLSSHNLYIKNVVGLVNFAQQ